MLSTWEIWEVKEILMMKKKRKKKNISMNMEKNASMIMVMESTKRQNKRREMPI
jgi:hypothetical protein